MCRDELRPPLGIGKVGYGRVLWGAMTAFGALKDKEVTVRVLAVHGSGEPTFARGASNCRATELLLKSSSHLRVRLRVRYRVQENQKLQIQLYGNPQRSPYGRWRFP